MNDTIVLPRARRSAPPAAMPGPGPMRQETGTILGLAARGPGRGKLAPWRFIVFEGEARAENERVAGFIHIGHADDLRHDRLRPLLADIVTWL